MEYKQYVYNYTDLDGNIWYNLGSGLKQEAGSKENFFNTNLVQPNTVWTKVGIQGPTGLRFKINNIDFILGKAGIYEVKDYTIKIFELVDENFSNLKNIIVDFCYVEGGQLE